MKSEASLTPKPSLWHRLGKLKYPLALARARGHSFAGAARLFYYAGIKPPLAYRGLLSFGADRIVHLPMNLSGDRVWDVFIRDNQLDIRTLAEFFSPGAGVEKEVPVREPAVIYDIGANIGISSLFFAARYPRAKIYGFEPLPSNLEICSMNFRNLQGGRAFPWAIGAQSGVTAFEFASTDNRGGRIATTTAGDWQTSNQRITVDVISIAELIEKKRLEPPEFVKIDVEGAEREVLKGIGSHVRSIQSMHLETHGPEIRVECLRWMRDNGFAVVGDREERPGFGAIWCSRR